MRLKALLAATVAASISASASATVFTETSPTSGPLPAGVTPVGGLVADLTGLNGNQVIAQLAASSMFVGFSSAGTGNPLLIGTQTGFDATVLAALGGGLSEASFRVTLWDGDSAPGNFDDGTDLTFLVDTANLGFWSAVATEQTSNDGTTSFGMGTGFGDSILSTGWFSTTDAGVLAAIFAGLGDGTLQYLIDDVDPNDNFYDFTQGVDGGLINVGQGPVVNPPTNAVPEPGTWAMMLMGFGAAGAALRFRRRSKRAELATA